ncbi:LrgB family protein [Bacillus dakarensis]|uniref:LrgB family protein n=1 Tax=Robertmurraya dakarensis TaxID=1926278 RepID=UPI0009824714|nr:LrgB family protein [Bacillus dakarensis]
MLQTPIALIIIVITVIIYLGMVTLYRKFPIPFLLPVLTSTIFIIAILKSFDLSYDFYMTGGHWLHSLLGPAVVSLAYPLFHQRKTIIKHALPILAGVLTGLISGMFTLFLLAEIMSIPRDILLSMIPKSITTPVAMQVANDIGGNPTLTVAFVMIAGISGAIMAPSLLKWFRIRSSLGTGIALGSSSHAIGTSKAFEYGEFTFSISSVSMTLSAIIGPIFGFLISKLLL